MVVPSFTFNVNDLLLLNGVSNVKELPVTGTSLINCSVAGWLNFQVSVILLMLVPISCTGSTLLVNEVILIASYSNESNVSFTVVLSYPTFSASKSELVTNLESFIKSDVKLGISLISALAASASSSSFSSLLIPVESKSDKLVSLVLSSLV